MSIFFFICFLFVFPIGLVVGLIEPSVFNKIFHGSATRKKTSILFGAGMLITFILFIATMPPTEQVSTQEQIDALRAKRPPVAVATSTPEVATPRVQPATTTPRRVKTPEEQLKSIMQSVMMAYDGNTGFTYQDVKIEKEDADRPSGTQMITVSINVGTVWNKSALLRDSGKLSSQVFQSVIPSSLNAYDVFVWFLGDTTDRYGNKKHDAILTYSMDKKTFEKINWQNFDATKLCDFLTQEERISGVASGPSCTMLVSME